MHPWASAGGLGPPPVPPPRPVFGERRGPRVRRSRAQECLPAPVRGSCNCAPLSNLIVQSAARARNAKPNPC
eukprot:14048475-Alexandrium_andersonii.AAC.1